MMRTRFQQRGTKSLKGLGASIVSPSSLTTAPSCRPPPWRVASSRCASTALENFPDLCGLPTVYGVAADGSVTQHGGSRNATALIAFAKTVSRLITKSEVFFIKKELFMSPGNVLCGAARPVLRAAPASSPHPPATRERCTFPARKQCT